MSISLFFAVICTFVLNFPFGYLREDVKKFSFLWFVYIHVPVPFVILFRHLFDLGYELYTYPFMVGAFFIGQFAGKKYKRYKNTTK